MVENSIIMEDGRSVRRFPVTEEMKGSIPFPPVLFKIKRFMECKRCKLPFKKKVKIDGKVRNLANRKYCLDCSPFGSHNSRKIHITEEEKIKNSLATCKICDKPYLRGHQKYKDTCSSCRITKHRQDRKKNLVNSFGGKCSICGYKKCMAALEFHHLDPTKKEINLSTASNNTNFFFKEAEKCILVCCRCHRELHAGLL